MVPIGAGRSVLDWLIPVLSLAALALLGAWIAFGIAHEPPRLDQKAKEVLGAPKDQAPADQKKGERG